jgi:hypothetical protein
MVTPVRRALTKGLMQRRAMVSSPKRSGNGIPMAGMGHGLGPNEEGSSGGGGVLTQSLTEDGRWR